jgi:hypothetical protein
MKTIHINSKQIIFLSLLSFLSFLSHSQDILWEKSLGGRHADYLMDAVVTPDYGYILAGSSLSQNSGNKLEGNVGNLDYWIWKMNEDVNPEWQKNFGGITSKYFWMQCTENSYLPHAQL